MIAQTSTVAELAEIIGVNRRRISKWRADEGAPGDLVVATWVAWLRKTGRERQAKDLERGAAKRRPPDEEQQQAAVALPEDPARWQKHDADTLKAREQALLARRQREVYEGRLVERADAERLFGALVAAVTAATRDGVWLAIRPMLGALPPDDQRAIRRAHDAAVRELQDDITQRYRKAARDLARAHADRAG